MAFSGNNQLIYNAAFNGCMAGAVAGAQIADQTATDYAALQLVANAFAQEVDSQIATDPQLATGAAGTTVPPATAAETSAQQAKAGIVFAVCFGFWFARPNWQSSQTPATYLNAALAVKAVYTQAVTGYGAAVGGTSLS